MGRPVVFDNHVAISSEKKVGGLIKNSVPLFSKYVKKQVEEAAKGGVKYESRPNFRAEVGVPHPYPMDNMNKWYCEIPILHGAVNKLVDFTVGPGFRVEVDDETAQELLEDFMRDMDFDNLLRKIVLDVLVYGNAFVEIVKDKKENELDGKIVTVEGKTIVGLIPRNPETMFIRRNEKGEVLGYSQLVGNILSEPIKFSLKEMAHFRLSQTGDQPYGMSALKPLQQIIFRKLALENMVSTLTRRKAGAPYDVKVGDEDNFAEASDLDAVRESLEDLQPDQEFVHNHLVEFKTLGSEGKVIDLNPYLSYFESQIIFGLEVPAVVLGQANVPEGLAKAQMDGFDRKITSIQLSIERTLEKDILQVFLDSNGKAQLTPEFTWKEPSTEQKQAEATLLLGAMGKMGMMSPEFLQQAEQKLADIFGFEDFVAPEKPEIDMSAPLPGQNAKGKPKPKEYVTESVSPLFDVTLKEYVGFNYQEYINNIKNFIDSKKFIKRKYVGFEFTPGTNQEEWEARVIKYSLTENLSKKQITALRNTLKKGFSEGSSIRSIKKEIENNVRPGSYTVKVPAVRDEDGEILRHSYDIEVGSETRAWALARTETIRAANQGALATFENLNVENVQWVATPDDRVCAYCDDQDGEKFDIEDADEMIPAHDQCRCTWVPLRE